MGKIILFTGGARSGKSTQAQLAAERREDVAYIATAVCMDEEMRLRIQKHVESRPQAWTTYECPYEIVPSIRHTRHSVYLLDCLTVYVTNLIFMQDIGTEDTETVSPDVQEQTEERVMRYIEALLLEMREKDAEFIIVTNEVGMGVVPQTPLGRLFRDIAGRVNQRVADAAEEVYLTVCGIPVRIKG